jgi:hypothetical protein
MTGDRGVAAWMIPAAAIATTVLGAVLWDAHRRQRLDIERALSTPAEQLRFISHHDYVCMVGAAEARRQSARATRIAKAANRRSPSGP